MLDIPNKKKPNPVDVAVGARIRLRRTMLGMSQERLADALGVTFQQVQKYEKGMNRVGASRLQAISTTLAMPISHFFGEDVSEAAPRSDYEAVLMSFVGSADGLALNRAFGKITNPAIRHKIVSLVKAIAAENDEA